jgi:hypothetical protein
MTEQRGNSTHGIAPRVVLHINPQGAGTNVGWVELARPNLVPHRPMLGLVKNSTQPTALQYWRAGQTEKAEHGHERLEAFRAVSLKIKPVVIEKALARAQPDPALAHIALDDLGRGVALVTERLREVAARIIENVAAAPIDEFEHAENGKAEAETELERLVDVIGARHALLDHARRLVHGERLNARDDIAGPRRAHDGDLADLFQQRPHPAHSRGIRLSRRGKLDQRNKIGGIEPMGVEKSLRMRHRGGKIVGQNGRCGRGDDRPCPAQAEVRASTSRLSSITSGTLSKITPAVASAAGAASSAIALTRSAIASR